MRIIYLTSGHEIKNGKGTGAISQFGDEAVEARKFVTALAKELWSKYKIMAYTDNDSWTLSGVITWVGSKVKSSDYTIDVHFNASANEAANGAEVLISNTHTPKEKLFATKIVNEIASTLSIKNRGVKTEADSQHSKLGILSNHKLSSANNILIEICFISNRNDMKLYFFNFNELITNLAKTINENIN